MEAVRSAIAWQERVKHRIHNFRMPIKSKRVLFLVQCTYFAVPLAIGYGLMKVTVPDAETMRGKLKLPTPEEQAQIDAHKRKLQADMDAARLAREARL
jgi:hypothetical protein|eukprot:jgi/Chrpa1/25380/Chrysochromulina_OHIO_Genome00006643-RA